MKIVPHTFQNHLNGLLGEFWRRDALREIEKISNQLTNGEITIDSLGVAYNCIGRVVTDEVAEILDYILTDGFSLEATNAAREIESQKFIEEYRKNPPKMTEEDLAEMRAAFDPDETVVDIFTGREYHTLTSKEV